VKFISVDIDEVPDLATKYSIKTVPTLVVLENGNEVNRVVGLSYISNFRQLFNDLVG
jgi:thioredoxin-like negative regulator of GroEL